jgi:hypothetical protein
MHPVGLWPSELVTREEDILPRNAPPQIFHLPRPYLIYILYVRATIRRLGNSTSNPQTTIFVDNRTGCLTCAS